MGFSFLEAIFSSSLLPVIGFTSIVLCHKLSCMRKTSLDSVRDNVSDRGDGDGLLHGAIGRFENVSVVIDIGSSSIRCSAYGLSTNNDITLIPNTLCKITFNTLNIDNNNSNNYIQNIYQNVEMALQTTLNNLNELSITRVDKIGFSSFVMNFFGLDHNNDVITPIYTYASDSNNYAEMPNVTDACIKEHYNRTGTILSHPSYMSVHLYNLFRTLDESHIHCWQSISSYIIAKWTSIPACPMSYSEASWTGLLNSDTLFWDSIALDRLKMNMLTLPLLCDFDEFEEKFSSNIVAKWPQLRNTKIYLSVGDGAAANIGSMSKVNFRLKPDVKPPMAVVTIGTSAAIRIHTYMRETKSFNGLWKYKITKDLSLIGGALTDGGSLIEWFGNCFGTETLKINLHSIERIILENQLQTNWEDNFLSLKGISLCMYES
jgi:gluconokinase